MVLCEIKVNRIDLLTICRVTLFCRFNFPLTLVLCILAGTEAPDSSCYVPEVTGVPGVANWLSMDAYEDMAHNMESIPDNIERVLQDCCMCVYSKT